MTATTGKQATFRAALVQMRSGRTPLANLDAAAKLIGEAKSGGADYVLTPEMTNVMEVSRQKLLAAIMPEESDVSLATFRELARKLSIYLHIGSLAIKVTPDKAANRSFLIDPHGEIVARYDKIHMFDVDLPGGESYRESQRFAAGDEAVVVELPFGRLGLSVCYDLRFAALYRTLAKAGAGFLAVPSAFTRQTGEAHWEMLLRARAIETGSFVLAAAQARHALREDDRAEEIRGQLRNRFRQRSRFLDRGDLEDVDAAQRAVVEKRTGEDQLSFLGEPANTSLATMMPGNLFRRRPPMESDH